MEKITLPERNRDAFEMLTQRSEAMIREAVRAPAREVVAVANPGGGYEIRTQLVRPGLFSRSK
jgi:hypothetical protein